MEPNWYDNYEEVLDFGKILHNAQILSPDRLSTYYQNPSSYDSIHSLWVEYGKPTRDNPLDSTWKEWIEESIEVAA